MNIKKQIRRKSKKRSSSPQQVVKSIPNMGNQARLKHGQPPNQHAYRAPGQSKPLLVFSPLSVKQVIPSSPRTNFLVEQYQRNQHKQFHTIQESQSHSLQASQTIKSGFLYRPINNINNNSNSQENGSHSTLQQIINNNNIPYTETVSFRQNSLLEFNNNQHNTLQSAIPGRESSLLDPSPSRAPSPIQLTPTYSQNKTVPPAKFPSPNITIVETPGIYNKVPSKTKPIEIPMMRVQAQKHRSKILLQNYQSGSHIKVVMGSHTSSTVQKKMSVDQSNLNQNFQSRQMKEQNLAKSPTDQQYYNESQMGLTNTSGTIRGPVNSNRASPQVLNKQLSKGKKQSLGKLPNQAGEVDKLEIEGKGGMISRRSSSGKRNISLETQQQQLSTQQHSSRETPGRNIVFSMTKQSIDSKRKSNESTVLGKRDGSHQMKNSIDQSNPSPIIKRKSMETLHDLYTRIQLQQSSQGSPTIQRRHQNFQQELQLSVLQSQKYRDDERKFINIPHLQEGKQKSPEQSTTRRSKFGPNDGRIRTTPNKLDLLAGGNSINSQKNSITDQQDSILTTTNTNFTPSKWIPKPDKALQQKQQIFQSLLNQYLPKNVKITKGSAGAGRYKTVNQDQLNGRKGSLRSQNKNIVIGQTQKQRIKYKRNKIRRNVLRDEMFLHRENDYFKEMFLDEYYKRRNIFQRNQYISHLQGKVYKAQSNVATAKQPQLDKTSLYNKIRQAHSIGSQNEQQFMKSFQTSKIPNQSSLLDGGLSTFISPSKLAQSFESVFQANATISYHHPQQNQTISTLQSPKSIVTQDIYRKPQFNRFSHLYKMSSKQGPLSKHQMSTKLNPKLQQMRQRFKNGEIRVGTSPISHSMYYQRLGLEMSKHLASKDKRAAISTTSTSTRRNKGLGEMINKFNRNSQVVSRENNSLNNNNNKTYTSTSRQSPGINKNNMRGAGKGTQISYTGAEIRTKQFYRDILSDTTTPLILPEIGLLMQKKNMYKQNRRLEKSAGDNRKYMSLGSRGDVKRLALTQNYFNKQQQGGGDKMIRQFDEGRLNQQNDGIRTADWSPRDSNVRMF